MKDFFITIGQIVLMLLVVCVIISIMGLPWVLLGPDTFWQRLAMFTISVPWAFVVWVISVAILNAVLD